MTRHAMHYRAGTHGMSHHGIPDRDPHWWCECKKWTFPARVTGAGINRAEAVKAHASHTSRARREDRGQDR